MMLMKGIQPPINNARYAHPLCPMSWKRRTDTDIVGTISAKRTKANNTPNTLGTTVPPALGTSVLPAPQATSAHAVTTHTATRTIQLSSTNHQYSERLARPLNVAYFFIRQVDTAWPKDIMGVAPPDNFPSTPLWTLDWAPSVLVLTVDVDWDRGVEVVSSGIISQIC